MTHIRYIYKSFSPLDDLRVHQEIQNDEMQEDSPSALHHQHPQQLFLQHQICPKQNIALFILSYHLLESVQVLHQQVFPDLGPPPPPASAKSAQALTPHPPPNSLM